MSAGRLHGKVAIVTGAASGFGRGIAEKFSQEGARVVIADVAHEAGQSAAARIGALFVKADVTSAADWEKLLAETLQAYGRLDVVVNNAGAAYSNKATEDVTEAEFDLVFRVNVKSVYVCTSVLLPGYFLKDGRPRPGCFIQVASTAATRPRPRLTWYNASKGAVVTATKSLALEYGPHQIRFNAVSPVLGSTGMTHLFLGKPDTVENQASFVSTVPLGRPSTPADVANACCYLASDEAGFITGVNLVVDGGRCA
ncbi:hypothetical protein E4U42_000179 [Claviceps africana]|uniref:Oxidoreductase, short-chain dehydrogenase/reductase family n=1 Tax=Claviceps africana TaxID=83212 RepID=A0A8K0NHZ6_9HYPO|nr:hypothetical protein E4U42_000179 [Claviceps africana]